MLEAFAAAGAAGWRPRSPPRLGKRVKFDARGGAAPPTPRRARQERRGGEPHPRGWGRRVVPRGRDRAADDRLLPRAFVRRLGQRARRRSTIRRQRSAPRPREEEAEEDVTAPGQPPPGKYPRDPANKFTIRAIQDEDAEARPRCGRRASPSPRRASRLATEGFEAGEARGGAGGYALRPVLERETRSEARTRSERPSPSTSRYVGPARQFCRSRRRVR